MKWTEALVLDVLYETYLLAEDSQAMDEWALLSHVPLRCPEGSGTNERIIDALAVRCWGGGPGHRRIAFEIKVSRQDFRNESDAKRAPAEASAHLCTYVTPAGLLDAGEIPPGWGLLEVFETAGEIGLEPNRLGRRAVWRKKPKTRTPVCDLDYLVSAGFRRASRAEREIRLGELPAAEVVQLRREVERLQGIASRAQDGRRTQEQRAKIARSELLAAVGKDDLVCADCGQPITWHLAGVNSSQWSHTNTAHDKPCNATRAEADRRRKEAQTGAKYGWGFAPPIEPKVFRDQRIADQQMEDAS